METPRFTINNFKQEIKDLAQLQHEDKLFVRQGHKWSSEQKDEFIIKNGDKLSCPEWEILSTSSAQSRCESRRIKLSSFYKYYYILKHWKKINADDDLSFIEFLEKGTYENADEDTKLKLIDDYTKKTYINQEKLDFYKKQEEDNFITYHEYSHLVGALKKEWSLLDVMRYRALKHIDKTEEAK